VDEGGKDVEDLELEVEIEVEVDELEALELEVIGLEEVEEEVVVDPLDFEEEGMFELESTGDLFLVISSLMTSYKALPVAIRTGTPQSVTLNEDI
jgi:hypothetical protein